VNTVMNLRVHYKTGNFLTSWVAISLSNRILLYEVSQSVNTTAGIKSSHSKLHKPKLLIDLGIFWVQEQTLHWQVKGSYLLTYLLIPWYRILLEKLIFIQLIKKYPAFFMEPECSSSCSQKLATALYPEPAESSSAHRSLPP
jgi:hypothetical protein